MLHKRHNSVITLAILLTLVGVSKPAKAFLLAQADSSTPTFNVPDRLAEDAEVGIVASNSTDSITSSLTDSFTGKYPQAEVNLETQGSDDALASVSAGEADLAAIGRSLTESEKAQGLISVPISREKIAIVVSPENSYDGNLTIGQFAQIFRGEITDWSEIGGSPGAIKLVDMPANNDTRQAFPNYPVFQEAEFSTGSTATQIEQDSTDAMIAELGENGIGYAVANDVIDRDDVKIVTMHQTQPGDPRYPFSQPFNLVYQGTPSEAAQAYLGYATTEGGQQIVANRVGSLSTAAVTAIASGAGAVSSPDADVNAEPNVSAANSNVDVEPDIDAVNPDSDVDSDVDAQLDDTDGVANADVDTDVDGSGTANSDLDGSGEINPDVDGSGAVNSDLEGSGEINPDVDGSGAVNSDLEGSGEINPDVEGSGEPLTIEGVEGEDTEVVVPNDTEGTEVAEKKGRWWLWLLPLLVIPLALGARALFGGGEKSDREPALDNVPPNNSPSGGVGVSGAPSGGVPPVGANVPGVGVAEGTANTASGMGAAGLAAGAAGLAAGGAALAGRGNRTENTVDTDPALDLDETATVEEIPSNPVTEFTGQETRLQTGDQSTQLQVDDGIDLDDVDSDPNNGISFDNAAVATGAAGLGGAAASFTRDRTTETSDLDLDTEINSDSLTTDGTGTTTRREFPGDYVLQEEVGRTVDRTAADTDTDLDLPEVDTASDSTSTTDLDPDPNIYGVSDSVAAPDLDLDTSSFVTPDTDINTDLPNVERPEGNAGSGIVDGVSRAGGAAALGGAAAASGMFDRGRDGAEDLTDVPDSEQDTDLDLGGATDVPDADFSTGADIRIDTPDVDVDTSRIAAPDTNINTDVPDADFSTGADIRVDTPNIDVDTSSLVTPDTDINTDLPNVERPEGNAGSGIVDSVSRAGGAAAASGMFDRGRDGAEDLTNVPDSEQDTDLDLGGAIDVPNADFSTGADVSFERSDVDADVNIDTSRIATPDVDLDSNIDPASTNITDAAKEVTPDLDNTTEIDTGVDTSSEIDTGIDVPNLEQDTDLNVDSVLDDLSGETITVDRDLNTDTNISLDNAGADIDTNSIAAPDTDINTDLPNVDRPEGSASSGVDSVSRAGGAAALGGAAAAAGMFNLRRDSAEDAAEVPDSEQDTDLNLNFANSDNDASVNVVDLRQDADAQIEDLPADTSLDNLNLDDLDLDLTDDSTINVVDLRQSESDLDVPQDVDAGTATFDIDSLDDLDLDSPTDVTGGINRGGATIAGDATALGGTSGLLEPDEDTSDTDPTASISDIQEFETFETSFELTDDIGETTFADNVVADAETTAIDARNSDATLDSVANTADFNLEEITLSDVDSNVSGSLEEITFNDAGADELSLDDITLDNADNNVNADLEEINFEAGGTTNYSLEEITFDDVEANTSLNLDDAGSTSETEISLDDLGFQESDLSDAASLDSSDDNTADITSISDDKSGDMSNISEWLDSLENPQRDNDSISDWLDTLEKDSVSTDSSREREERETTDNFAEEADDISFQFLEDLLDRDADRDRQDG